MIHSLNLRYYIHFLILNQQHHKNVFLKKVFLILRFPFSLDVVTHQPCLFYYGSIVMRIKIVSHFHLGAYLEKKAILAVSHILRYEATCASTCQSISYQLPIMGNHFIVFFKSLWRVRFCLRKCQLDQTNEQLS